MTTPQPTLYQVSPGNMSGLTDKEIKLFNKLLEVWARHIPGNLRNDAYYTCHNRLKDLRIAIPPQLTDVETVVGWPAKAVDSLAARSVLRGFAVGDAGIPELDEAFAGNGMRDLYRQAVTSQLVGSCAFLTVSKGLPSEPDALISAHSAINAAALWDERQKRIRAGIVVVDVTEDTGGFKRPSWVNLYTDAFTLSCKRLGNGRWTTERMENPLNRPLMEPLRYRPTLDRPFGKSRISPAVRSITDSAVRAALRTEVAAEFYTAPQRYLLGADKKTAESYAQRRIETYVDRMFIATANRNGDVPQYGQLPQMTMQPHTEYMQSLAKRLAGETGVPLTDLGIVFDNPSSAEAMYAAQNNLIIEAEWLNEANGAALRNIALMALACLRGVSITELSDTERTIEADWEDPTRPSKAARADFAMKVASVVPEYAQTDMFWRDLGYSSAQIRQVKDDIKRAKASAAIMSLLAPKKEADDGSGAAQPTG